MSIAADFASISLEDRRKIQDLSYEYAFHCDTQDYARCPQLFTDDGIFDERVIGIPRAENKTEIGKLFAAASEANAGWLQHFMHSIWLKPQADATVRGICYLRVEGGDGTGLQRVVQGYYDDVYRQVGERWRIASRTLVAIAPPTGWAPAID